MSSNLKKTIKINPDLFRSSSSGGTRKMKEKKQKPAMNLLIQPNALKKKLLSRIKDYKSQEETERKSEESSSSSKSASSSSSEFTDEFMESINYLNSLSKKKKEEEKQKHQQNQQQNIPHPQLYQQKQMNRTVRNPYVKTEPMVQLELPEELMERPARSVSMSPDIIQGPSIHLNYNNNNNNGDVPYGCLKNGTKPTYRQWNSTRKNMPPSAMSSSIRIEQPVPQVNTVSEREQKLEILKQKLKLQQDALQNEKRMMTQNMIQKPEPTYVPNNYTPEPIQPYVALAPTIMPPAPAPAPIPMASIAPLLQENELKDFVEEIRTEPKKMIKRTIKKRYTLGKSSVYRKVGVLIKDKNTRKKIINAHKELKKEPLNDVKKYLRNHGLIKVGSNAPTNVIRQIYESSMMSGDISNNNKDVLLHNFLSETEE